MTVAESSALKAQIVTVTPEIAEGLLQRNTHNRSVVRSRVDQYAADMRRGNWAVNGEAIKIAHTGQILDGQHRILAILEADTAIQTLVITGLEPEAQETMDQGRPRQLCDVLKLRGEAEYYALAAATKIVATYERHGTLFPDSFRRPPTIHESMRTLERNPDIRNSVRLAAKHKVRWVPYSSVGALHYLFASVDEADADDFLLKLARGENITAASPIWVLRERLIRARSDRVPLTYKTKMAFVIRAWNAYRNGDQLVRLTWNPGGANPDKFPRIDGLAEPANVDDELQEAA